MTRLVRIMALMGLFLLLVQINRQGGGVMAIYFADIRNLSAAQIGGISGAMYLASALAQIPTGILYDRFGARRTLAGLGVLGVAGVLLFAIGDTVPSLATGRLLIGIGHGGVITGIYLLAIAWTSHERMASVSSLVIGIAGGIGGLLATTPLAVSLREFGFQATFIAVAVLTGIVTVAISLFVRDAPPGGAPAACKPEGLSESLKGVWSIMRDPDMHRLIAMGFCFSAPFSTIGGLWAGPYLFDIYKLSQEQASYALFAMIVAFNVGTLTYGPMDRVFNTRKWVILVGVLAMILLLLALVVFADTALWLTITLLVAFSFATPFYVTLMAHCRGFVPIHMMGRAITVISLAGIGGIFLLQFGTGLVMEAMANADGSRSLAGYRMVFSLIAGVLLISGGYYATVRDVPARAPLV